MVPERIETERLILRKFKKEDVDKIYKSWSNPQNYRYNEITWNKDEVAKMLNYEWPTSWGNYYFIAEDKKTGETVATPRFGKYWNSKPEDMVWDFGYNAFRSDDKGEYTVEDIKKAFAPNGVTKDKNWGRGYASEMIGAVLDVAKQEGVKSFNVGASIKNYASLKVMLKNGFEFSKIDEDNDYELILDLTKDIKIPTKEQMEKIWDNFTKMAEKDLQDSKLKKKINKDEINHYYKAIMYLTFNKVYNASKLENEGVENNTDEIKRLKNNVVEIFKGLTAKERSNFMKYLTKFENACKQRVGSEYGNERNNIRLKLCKQVKELYENNKSMFQLNEIIK